MTNTQTKQIDINDEIESLEQAIDDVLDEAEVVADDSETYEELEVEYQAYEVRKQTLADLIDRFGGSVFEIRELTFGEVMHIRDKVRAQSENPEAPREGLYKSLVIQDAVVDQPAGAPSDPTDWPETLGEWVYDEIDRMNAGVDEETLGNLSLAEALDERTET